MSNDFDRILEILTEISQNLNTIARKHLVHVDEIFTSKDKGNAGLISYVLYSNIEKTMGYFDETDDKIKMHRIEPEIENLCVLYADLNLNDLIDIEKGNLFSVLRKKVSSNLKKRNINPTKALRLVILDLLVYHLPDYSINTARIEKWAKVLMEKEMPWMAFAYLKGVLFEDVKLEQHGFVFSSTRGALTPSDWGEWPKTEPDCVIGSIAGKTPFITASSAKDVYQMFYQFVICLRLVDSKPVQILMTHVRGMLDHQNHIHKHWVLDELLSSDNYRVTQENLDSVSKTLRLIHPILKELNIQPWSYGNDYRSIAIKHYEDALLADDPVRSVASAVVALEAIYGLEQGEITYRLKQRVCRLVGFILANNSNLRKEIVDAYGIRSRFIHGQKPSLPDPEFLKRLLELVRISLLIVLLLGYDDKKQLIECIDMSMIDNKKASGLLSHVTQKYELIVKGACHPNL